MFDLKALEDAGSETYKMELEDWSNKFEELAKRFPTGKRILMQSTRDAAEHVRELWVVLLEYYGSDNQDDYQGLAEANRNHGQKMIAVLKANSSMDDCDYAKWRERKALRDIAIKFIQSQGYDHPGGATITQTAKELKKFLEAYD